MARSPQPVIQMGPSFESEWPGASALATEVVLNLGWLSERILAYGAVLVRAHGLTSLAALNVLTILEGAGEPLPPSVIAERMIVTRATMTRTIRSLQTRGLVRVFPHTRDRRMSMVELTPAGRKQLTALHPVLHEAEKRWVECLSQAELRTLLRMLVRIQAARPG